MRHFFFSILFSCLLVETGAQKMEDIFIKMPDDLIVQLEEAWRKDLVELYKSRKPAVVDNTMMGKSILNKLTDDYLLLQTTERSNVELRLLPLVNNTHIICMIQTIYGPVADSRISFFTTEWQQLLPDDLITPVDADWFRHDDADQTVFDSFSSSELFLLKYSLSEEKAILTAEYMTPYLLDDNSQKAMKALIKTENKTYEWKSGRFE